MSERDMSSKVALMLFLHLEAKVLTEDPLLSRAHRTAHPLCICRRFDSRVPPNTRFWLAEQDF